MVSNQVIKEMIDDLYNEVPEFKIYAKSVLDDETLHNYLVFDYLGDYVKLLISEHESSEIALRCYNFINKVCKGQTKEVLQWVKETFLESTIDSGKTREYSLSHLSGKALILFQENLNHPFFGGATRNLPK